MPSVRFGGGGGGAGMCPFCPPPLGPALELVRNSRGKRAISVRATEVLLYFVKL